MSLFGCLAWAAMSGVIGITLISEAYHFQPVISRCGWLLGGGFVLLMTAGLADSYRNKSL